MIDLPFTSKSRDQRGKLNQDARRKHRSESATLSGPSAGKECNPHNYLCCIQECSNNDDDDDKDNNGISGNKSIIISFYECYKNLK